ncbi:DUF2790 domain-containing protein [Stutzerimonas urumqiensis]|uniref:DUF2790 domain-containing protein n=1 Tax=Stutzerimonas urumqiensis TaxID=638269 RepID=UPI000EB0B1B3|nr:DUF2790 domain-containing protein [Stutzerimonas urumqiensis]
MKLIAATLATLTAIAPLAFAGTAEKPTDHHPAITYEYGQPLDVKKVLSITDTSQAVGIVPVTLVYEDSQGTVREVQFVQYGSAGREG